uniref:Ig-like domain-containing protein n=1 Tax=Sander lucioperca TaxID=283035 RepID=A0A8D0A2V7_SANLU
LSSLCPVFSLSSLSPLSSLFSLLSFLSFLLAVIGGERCVVERGGRGTFSLVVGGVREEDVGRYTCQATNQAGSRQVTVEILLEGLNHGCIKRTGSSVRQEALYFNAKTTGRPPPQVTWYKVGGAELQSSGRVSVYERSGLHFLEIKEVSSEDAGSYTCFVSNNAGTATATSTLTVQGAPTNKSPASTATSTLTVQGEPTNKSPASTATSTLTVQGDRPIRVQDQPPRLHSPSRLSQHRVRITPRLHSPSRVSRPIRVQDLSFLS